MANTIPLGIILDALWKGGKAVADADKDIKKLNKNTDDASASMKKWGKALAAGGAAVAAVGFAAKEAYEFISEGAQLDLAARQFDNLALSIDTTSSALMDNLRSATKGMQSDAELIAGASEIISLGLANNEKDVVRLANAVGTLGLNMQQVVMTFANNSKARLDSLGLSVEGVTKRVEELNREGFDGDAFDAAVLEQLEERMVLLGDATETTAGQLQIMEKTWQTFTENLKRGAAEAVFPLVKRINEANQVTDLLEEAQRKGAITAEEYGTIMIELQHGLTDATTVIEDMNEAIAVANDEMRMGKTALQDLEDSFSEMTNVAAEAAASWEEYIETSGKAIVETSSLTSAAILANSAFSDWAGGVVDLKGDIEETSTEVGGLLGLMADLEGEYNANFNFTAYGVDKLSEAKRLWDSLRGFNQGWDDSGFIPTDPESSGPPPGYYENEEAVIDNPSIPVMPVPPSTQPADPGLANGFNITQHIGAGVDADMVRRATQNALDIALARGRI